MILFFKKKLLENIFGRSREYYVEKAYMDAPKREKLYCLYLEYRSLCREQNIWGLV